MSWVNLLLAAILLGFVSWQQPQYLDDSNDFLKAFVGVDFLALLGFTVSLTVASAANIYMHLISIPHGGGFPRAKAALRKSVMSLLVLFAVAVAVLVSKPILGGCGVAGAAINSFAILILFFNIAVMYDIAMTALALPAIRTRVAAEDSNI